MVKEEGRLFLECGGVWCVREEEGFPYKLVCMVCMASRHVRTEC